MSDREKLYENIRKDIDKKSREELDKKTTTSKDEPKKSGCNSCRRNK